MTVWSSRHTQPQSPSGRGIRDACDVKRRGTGRVANCRRVQGIYNMILQIKKNAAADASVILMSEFSIVECHKGPLELVPLDGLRMEVAWKDLDITRLCPEASSLGASLSLVTGRFNNRGDISQHQRTNRRRARLQTPPTPPQGPY